MPEKITDAYIRERYGKIPQENIDSFKSAMQKYGSNYWWESKDKMLIAEFQFFEPVLFVKFDLFHEGLEQLLNRPVFNYEMGLNYYELQKEVQLALKRKKLCIGISDEQREESFKRSINMLENYCARNGKKLLKFEISADSDNMDRIGNDDSDYDG